MLTPFILVLGLMVATGVIAYWSDNLGKKLGKKRVSLLGLRPKQTATLITIASSLLIMLFTLGVMLATYRPLRHALLRFDSVRAANERLVEQNKILQADLGSLEEREKRLVNRSRRLS